jgi:hypothetical protein
MAGLQLEGSMRELLVKFTATTRSQDSNDEFWPEVYGTRADDGLWEAWIEFTPVGGGDPIRTDRETKQPNRDLTMYWAQGLSATYLEGALERALKPITSVERKETRRLVTSPPRSAPPSHTWESRSR